VDAVSGKMLEAQLQQSIHSFPVRQLKLSHLQQENIAVIANHLNAFSIYDCAGSFLSANRCLFS
jgi:hypothetical protein